MKKIVVTTDDGVVMKKDQPWYYVSKMDFKRFGEETPDWKTIHEYSFNDYFYFKEKSSLENYVKKCARKLVESLDEI